jgi:hypothetical protein
MGVNLRTTSGPVLEKAGDLAAMLTNLEPHDVLFIDEIHRLSPVVEEVLYPAMEDYQLDIMIGEGRRALHQNRSAAVYPDWRHDARRVVDLTARAFRHRAASGVLSGGWPAARYSAAVGLEGERARLRAAPPRIAPPCVRAEVKHDGRRSEIAARALDMDAVETGYGPLLGWKLDLWRGRAG